jgi:hypothetical protein
MYFDSNKNLTVLKYCPNLFAGLYPDIAKKLEVDVQFMEQLLGEFILTGINFNLCNEMDIKSHFYQCSNKLCQKIDDKYEPYIFQFNKSKSSYIKVIMDNDYRITDYFFLQIIVSIILYDEPDESIVLFKPLCKDSTMMMMENGYKFLYYCPQGCEGIWLFKINDDQYLGLDSKPMITTLTTWKKILEDHTLHKNNVLSQIILENIIWDYMDTDELSHEIIIC